MSATATEASTVDQSAENETKARLIRSAERLVAQKGVDAVSVRSICADADLNPAAVHYHFGNKEALLGAVLEARMNEVSERRLGLLRELDDVEEPTAGQVAAALVTPLAEVAATPGGRDYVEFLTRLSADRGAYRDQLASAFAPQLEPLLRVLERAVPHVDPRVLTYRLALAGDVLLSAFGGPDRDLIELLATGPDDSSTQEAILAAHVTDFVAGALSGASRRADDAA